jgi:magnesium transporter
VSVVAAHLYRNGKKAKSRFIGRAYRLQGQIRVCLDRIIRAFERELEQLEKNYGLHPLAIEDALKANQMPKVDVYGDQLFVTTRTAHLEHDPHSLWRNRNFCRENFIISVRHGSARAHSDLRAQLEAAPSLLGPGPRLCSPRHPRLYR